MSESVCRAAGGEGRTRDWLAQVHHMQLRNKINCLADFSDKTPALLCSERTMSLLPCFREALPAHCIGSHLDLFHLLQYSLDHQHMRVEAARVGRAEEGLVCICRALVSPVLRSLDWLQMQCKSPELHWGLPWSGATPSSLVRDAQLHPRQGEALKRGKRGGKAVTEGPELS